MRRVRPATSWLQDTRYTEISCLAASHRAADRESWCDLVREAIQK